MKSNIFEKRPKKIKNAKKISRYFLKAEMSLKEKLAIYDEDYNARFFLLYI